MFSTNQPQTGNFINLTTTLRDALVNPRKGLTIFNTTTSQWEGNKGTPATPVWVITG